VSGVEVADLAELTWSNQLRLAVRMRWEQMFRSFMMFKTGISSCPEVAIWCPWRWIELGRFHGSWFCLDLLYRTSDTNSSKVVPAKLISRGFAGSSACKRGGFPGKDQRGFPGLFRWFQL